MYIGSHVDARGCESLVELLKNYHAKSGGKTAQIVGGSTWFRKEASEVRTYIQETGMRFYLHSPFTWNLAKEVTHENKSLIRDLKLADALGAEGCVLHMGKSVKLDKSFAEECFMKNLSYVLEQTKYLRAKLFIETCAGQGTDLYATKDGTLDELVRFYSQFTSAQKKRLLFCVDTCHIFAAGYDIHTDQAAETFWMEWQHKLGIESLGVIHMNNSAKPYQSHVDRHAALQYGHIGIGGLASFAQTAVMHEIPMVIETPLLEYDIPVLESMIEGTPLPNIESIRHEQNLRLLA